MDNRGSIGLQALVSEQQRRRKVVIHRFVVAEMVLREIGQNRGVELKNIESARMVGIAAERYGNDCPRRRDQAGTRPVHDEPHRVLAAIDLRLGRSRRCKSVSNCVWNFYAPRHPNTRR